MTHPTRFSACPPTRMLAEWQGSRNALEDLLGHEIRVASVPGGYFSETVARTAREAGLTVLFTSEPWLGAKSIHGCAVAGRFTVRSGRRLESLEGLVRGSLGTRCREWAAWNLKKVVKPVLGSAYPRLGEWLASVQLQGGRR